MLALRPNPIGIRTAWPRQASHVQEEETDIFYCRAIVQASPQPDLHICFGADPGLSFVADSRGGGGCLAMPATVILDSGAACEPFLRCRPTWPLLPTKVSQPLVSRTSCGTLCTSGLRVTDPPMSLADCRPLSCLQSRCSTAILQMTLQSLFAG